MASLLNPYILFAGNTREAMEFYRSVFGGTLNMITYGDFGSPVDGDKIMHAILETDSGFTIMAADTPPGAEHNVGTDMAVSLSGDDAAELRRYWDKLSASGTTQTPLDKQVWGDTFGACADRFGVSWLVNIAE
ncbi:VOC family protein [Rhodococcus spongiicola]|uniref:VOC family protein n=1 Tax=Rhodococcus spongiicola TaxID=2487352 RepID=A0A3S3DZH9_9NOCA|nr:VOC family protein [Rhodococcus spongiicola]RVW02467.1 VOC family protein [Rhodococcus spongiicola]